MATYTVIPDTVLEPLKPIRSVDGLALRDNPIAIAEGAAGAPRIAASALQTGTPERDWVLGRVSDATSGAIGTYVFAQRDGATQSFGSTTSGSNLSTANAGGSPTGSESLLGTWRCMGDSVISASEPAETTLWLRIS